MLAAPPVASRLARFKLPNSWCLYGPLLFAKPVAAGVVLTTPVAAAYYYNTSPCAERPGPFGPGHPTRPWLVPQGMSE